MTHLNDSFHTFLKLFYFFIPVNTVLLFFSKKIKNLFFWIFWPSTSVSLFLAPGGKYLEILRIKQFFSSHTYMLKRTWLVTHKLTHYRKILSFLFFNLHNDSSWTDSQIGVTSSSEVLSSLILIFSADFFSEEKF